MCASDATHPSPSRRHVRRSASCIRTCLPHSARRAGIMRARTTVACVVRGVDSSRTTERSEPRHLGALMGKGTVLVERHARSGGDRRGATAGRSFAAARQPRLLAPWARRFAACHRQERTGCRRSGCGRASRRLGLRGVRTNGGQLSLQQPRYACSNSRSPIGASASSVMSSLPRIEASITAHIARSGVGGHRSEDLARAGPIRRKAGVVAPGLRLSRRRD
jgi:hypothetical protein